MCLRACRSAVGGLPHPAVPRLAAPALLAVPSAAPSAASTATGQRRWRSWVGQVNERASKVGYLRKRALEQHVDYVRQLEAPRPYRPVEVDPKVLRRKDELRLTFNNPELMIQPSEDTKLVEPEAALSPLHAGLLGQLDIEHFGKLEVFHDDIFSVEAEALILPMTANLLPYRGLALEVFDRGGPELVQAAFDAASNGKTRMKGLQPGDTFRVQGRGVAAKNILFVVMPWFWQGSPVDAAKRFRHCLHQALLEASGPNGFASVALPHLGGGIFGYEPRSSCRIAVEEAVEAMLQIEAEVPSYKLEHIKFVDSRKETADELYNALMEARYRWVPDRRIVTAPQWWGRQTRRLVVLPASPNWFWRRHRVKFKKHHGVPRKARKNFRGNVRPWVWRPQKVLQPPPLMVFQESGDVAPQDVQPSARPFYFRGVSHWLFPSRRSGYHALRKGANGQWVASPRAFFNFQMQDIIRPRS